jgi:hypothetical protein
MAVLDDVLAELPPARRSSTRVEADSVTVEHDRDAAVVLWQWPAAAPKDVGRYETGLEAVTRPEASGGSIRLLSDTLTDGGR